jgi:hypothetical protein
MRGGIWYHNSVKINIYNNSVFSLGTTALSIMDNIDNDVTPRTLPSDDTDFLKNKATEEQE